MIILVASGILVVKNQVNVEDKVVIAVSTNIFVKELGKKVMDKVEQEVFEKPQSCCSNFKHGLEVSKNDNCC